ncbi:hypothetical protein ScPMuIL_013718 [Solemya velum]
MSRLTGEITLEHIDDWFKIGKKKTAPIQSVSRSATGGRCFDPSSSKPRVLTEPSQFVPHYKRDGANFGGGTQYAVQYQRAEEEQLIRNAQPQGFLEDGSVASFAGTMEQLELDSVSGSVVPDELVPENATDVYNNYPFGHQYDNGLPITKFQEEIIATVESNQVTVIQGSTGSGKTTQVPQYILDHYARMNKHCNIIVTQPRRIAAISIARRVCQERNWGEPGTVCGYQVSMDKKASQDTRILYVTTGVLLQMLIKTKNMLQFTHVILDEVHERDKETDFALLVVRRFLRTNSRHVKVILMSATLDSDIFAQYFALPVRDRLEPAPVVSVEGRAYDVSEFYLEDLPPELGEKPKLDESDPKISEQSYILATNLIKALDQLEYKAVNKIKDQKNLYIDKFLRLRGTVLVFLPGLGEITDMHTHLENLEKLMLKIIPLHSTITLEEQSKVFEIAQPGYRKVILSTNIAESSITVPDIRYVFDFCLNKSLMCDQETNYSSLQLHWASKANCIQRRGRAGRVAAGRVYRMVTRSFYDFQLADFGVPAVQREPLESIVLKVKVLDIGEPKEILALALSPPSLNDIERTILILKEVGALTTITSGTGNRHDGKLTFVGRVLESLPVDIRIGKLLVLGHELPLSLKSVFAKPFKRQLDAYKRKIAWADASFSDCIAILMAYQIWKNMSNRGEFKRSGQNEMDWGRRRFLQVRRFRDVTHLVEDMERRLSQFNIQKPRRNRPNFKRDISDDEERLLLKLVICGAVYPNYFLRGEVDEQDALKCMSGHDPFNTVYVKGFPANQGSLYKMAIEDEFSKCEGNATAYFEETKGYIEFKWKPEYKGKVHPSVFYAVKMRQLRLPIVINLYSAGETHSLMKKLHTQQQQASSLGHLRTNRLKAVNSQSRFETGQQVALPDARTSTVMLVVTHVVECGHFWAMFKNNSDLHSVQKAMNANQGSMLQPLTGTLLVGMLCIAPYQDEDTSWYRARIEKVERESALRELITVFFVDYGNTQTMPREYLRFLPQELIELPFQAVECKLCKIRPSPKACPEGRWTQSVNQEFIRMVDGSQFFGQIFSIIHGVLRLELIDVRPNGVQICINDVLVQRQIAEEAEESFISKQNNEERLLEAGDPTYRSSIETSEGFLPAEKPRDWLEVSVGGGGGGPPRGKKGQKCFLTGPFNPYELNFINMTSVGRMRAVRIDPESVNSVAIDDEPEKRCARLMVAGFVSLNPSGSTVICRDTTIMPLIPGLPALVALLFAPVAELRTDREKRRYTGCICGLGLDPVGSGPALPDHDMEITFDTVINMEDILRINSVRMAINLAVGSQDVISSWGETAIFKIQASARERILQLIMQRREAMEPCHFSRPYQWNQVDPADILSHGIENTNDDCPVLLNLHNGIALVNEEEEIQEEKLALMKKHAKWLREVAQKPRKREPVFCKLCNITCQTPQLLAFHLETRKHMEHENALNEND